MFDPAILVPLAIRWPGVVKPGTRIEQMVGHIDFLETLCDVAHVPAQQRPPNEGRSFLPLLEGRHAPSRDPSYGSFDQYQYKPKAHLRMIRTDDWKLVRDFAEGGRDELYHLAQDPGELVNLIDAPAHAAVRRDLAARLDAWRRRMDDPTLKKS
jgi:uncharacterized sulfatase